MFLIIAYFVVCHLLWEHGGVGEHHEPDIISSIDKMRVSWSKQAHLYFSIHLYLSKIRHLSPNKSPVTYIEGTGCYILTFKLDDWRVMHNTCRHEYNCTYSYFSPFSLSHLKNTAWPEHSHLYQVCGHAYWSNTFSVM